jgi:RimJ/RimL family protein N-acetyltransferase
MLIGGIDLNSPAPNVYYTGRRCVLRPLMVADIRHLYARPDVLEVLAAYRPWYRPHLHPIEWVMERHGWLAALDPPIEFEALILAQPQQEPIGFISLAGVDAINRKAELSIGLFEKKGTRIGLEALHWVLKTSFEMGRMHKLVFCVADHNAEAHRLLKSLGIEQEAVLKEEMQAEDGTRQDLHRYALFASQWHDGLVRAQLERVAPV